MQGNLNHSKDYKKNFKFLILKNCKLKYFCAVLQNKTLSMSLCTDSTEFHAKVQKTAIILHTYNSGFTLSVIHISYNTGLSSGPNFCIGDAPSTRKCKERVFSLILFTSPLFCNMDFLGLEEITTQNCFLLNTKNLCGVGPDEFSSLNYFTGITQ